MDIRCPKCGRLGHLPDHWVPNAHSLRCRKCRALFKTPEVTRAAADRGMGVSFEPIEVPVRAETRPAFVADGFFSAFEDSLRSPRESGPGDSNYELTFSLRDAEGDSGTHWDAGSLEIEPEAPSSDELPAASPSPTVLDPWHHRFIRSWGLVLIVSALILIALSVPTTAYLLWRAYDSGPSPDRQTPTLIAGFACAVAMLMISVPLTLLAASVTELVRDLRRLDRRAGLRDLLGRR